MAAKPNLVEADFKVPATIQDGEVVTQTGTSVTTTTGTSLVPTTSTAVATVDTTPLEEPGEKDRRQYKKLVDYKKFNKGFKANRDALKALVKGLKTILDTIRKGAGALAKLALSPMGWLNDNLFAFLTSPLAKDIVKTFMYANPFTKMLFDGDFGKLSIGSLDKIHKALQDKIQNAKNRNDDPTKEDPKNYTERKLPKSLDNKTLKQLKKEFFGNKALVDLINVSYNHPDVKIQDKADLQKYTNQIQRAIKIKNVEGIRSKFKSLIKTCDKICDYMDWNKPRDWQGLVKLYVRLAGGNTKKEQEKIKSKNKPKKDVEKKTNDISDEAIDQIVDKLAKKLKQESFEERITKLERLLEEAEGDK